MKKEIIYAEKYKTLRMYRIVAEFGEDFNWLFCVGLFVLGYKTGFAIALILTVLNGFGRAERFRKLENELKELENVS